MKEIKLTNFNQKTFFPADNIDGLIDAIDSLLQEKGLQLCFGDACNDCWYVRLDELKKRKS